MTEAARPITIPLSSIISAHKCMDSRHYVINLSRLFPPDRRSLPPPHSLSYFSHPDLVTHLLRPEFVTQYLHFIITFMLSFDDE